MCSFSGRHGLCATWFGQPWRFSPDGLPMCLRKPSASLDQLGCLGWEVAFSRCICHIISSYHIISIIYPEHFRNTHNTPVTNLESAAFSHSFESIHLWLKNQKALLVWTPDKTKGGLAIRNEEMQEIHQPSWPFCRCFHIALLLHVARIHKTPSKYDPILPRWLGSHVTTSCILYYLTLLLSSNEFLETNPTRARNWVHISTVRYPVNTLLQSRFDGTAPRARSYRA